MMILFVSVLRRPSSWLSVAPVPKMQLPYHSPAFTVWPLYFYGRTVANLYWNSNMKFHTHQKQPLVTEAAACAWLLQGDLPHPDSYLRLVPAFLMECADNRPASSASLRVQSNREGFNCRLFRCSSVTLNYELFLVQLKGIYLFFSLFSTFY